MLLPVILPLPLAFDFGVPFRNDGAGGENPKGDVHGFGGDRRSIASLRRTGSRRAAAVPDSSVKRASTSFFYGTGMSRRKIPAAEWTRSAAGTEGVEAGACLTSHSAFGKASLLVTSLCASKEK